MKKFLILALLFTMLITPSFAIPDVYDQLRGKQMVADRGAPWFADSAVMYFGTGKDVAITYSPTADKVYVNDTDVYLEEDVTIAGNLGVSGTTISNGKTTDPFWVDDLFYVTNTAALNATTATTVTAEQLTSTDDALVIDDLTVDGLARIDEGLTANTIAINTTGTFTGIQTFTAAPVFNAGVLIPTGDTLNTVDADGVKSGGVIVPQEMVINVPITTSEPDQTIFIADDAWQITKIEEVHATAQNTAFPNTGSVTVTKCTGTQAAASGSVLHNTSMYLNSTVETVQTPALNAATGALNLADGNRLAINVNGTMTTFANGLITIHMKRI
jgi:hypothetical protein